MRGGAPVEGACSTACPGFNFNGAELDEQDALIRCRFSPFTKKSRFSNDPQIKAKPTPYIGYATINKISQRCLLHVNGEPLFLSERLFGRTVSEAKERYASRGAGATVSFHIKLADGLKLPELMQWRCVGLTGMMGARGRGTQVRTRSVLFVIPATRRLYEDPVQRGRQV
jgi:hypothetical protein